MTDINQFQIIQEVVTRAIKVAETGWCEMIISYCIDESQSNFCNSYLIEKDGLIKEKPLPFVNSFDSLLRKLREHLAQAERQPFTKCKLHVTSDGKYEVVYGYDAVDWNALLIPAWNFSPAQKELSHTALG